MICLSKNLVAIFTGVHATSTDLRYLYLFCMSFSTYFRTVEPE